MASLHSEGLHILGGEHGQVSIYVILLLSLCHHPAVRIVDCIFLSWI